MASLGSGIVLSPHPQWLLGRRACLFREVKLWPTDTLRLRPLTTGASKGLDVQSGNSVLGWIQWGPSQQLGFANVYDCTYEDQGSTLGVIPQGPLPLRQSVFH